MSLRIVTGPPSAGKTTYVREHAQPGDVVIDYDRLAQALSAEGADSHRHAEAVRTVAYAARTAAIASALRRVATVDVWIIHTRPRSEAMDKYARHGAEVITIDPGQDVVTQRAARLRGEAAQREVTRWYEVAQGEAHAELPQGEGSRSW